jgi:hypothetical protein
MRERGSCTDDRKEGIKGRRKRKSCTTASGYDTCIQRDGISGMGTHSSKHHFGSSHTCCAFSVAVHMEDSERAS